MSRSSGRPPYALCIDEEAEHQFYKLDGSPASRYGNLHWKRRAVRCARLGKLSNYVRIAYHGPHGPHLRTLERKTPAG